MESDFQIKNEEMEKRLKDLGDVIKKGMPPGWGFTLMMFDYNTTEGSMFYISSAARGDMIKAMQEFIKKEGLNSESHASN